MVAHHEAAIYSDEHRFIRDLAEFVCAGLKSGNAVIALATVGHLSSLASLLSAHCPEFVAATEQGRYLPFDAAELMSRTMHEEVLDGVRFLGLMHELVTRTRAVSTEGKAGIVIFEECAHLLQAQGHSAASIEFEKLCSQVASSYDAKVRCSYFLDSFQGEQAHILRQICTEHAAVYAR